LHNRQNLQKQSTIAEKVSCTGVGLHSGRPTQLTLRPARADTGIVFLLRDRAGVTEVPACPAAVSSTANATCLAGPRAAGSPLRPGESERRSVATVEHLLAALYALRVDNVIVEIEGAEVPALDGSALPFVELLHAAGIYEQGALRACLRVDRPLEVVDGERSVRLEPADGFAIDYVIDFAHPAIGRQRCEIPSLDPHVFEHEIAGARTFGFLDEAEALWQSGLARGGSLENTVVVGEPGVINPEGLRWPDEFVRHKVLDLIGDLALLGASIQGRVRVERGGHSLHHALIRALQESPDAWSMIVASEARGPGASAHRDGRPARLGAAR
jgi:UDP-3-O-[3-hydroxymyristoyl] N-acetylglucosamine deacetylase